MSIDVWAHVAFFLLILIVYGPSVVFVKYWDKLSCDWDKLYLE